MYIQHELPSVTMERRLLGRQIGPRCCVMQNQCSPLTVCSSLSASEMQDIAATGQETTNFQDDWLNDAINSSHGGGVDCLLDRVATMNVCPNELNCGGSDHRRNQLHMDALRASNQNTGLVAVEPYLLGCCDSLASDHNRVDMLTYALDHFVQDLSPDRLSHSAPNVEPHAGGMRTFALKGQHKQYRTSILRQWLQHNGLKAYPNPEQIKGLAATAGISSKQARNALSNFRARMKPSE
jgi:hypothetical protein